MATMHKLVSPEGVLHLLPVDDRSILEFTKVHGIKDKKYLMNHLRGKQDESYGWQLLAKVKWLKHSSGVVIPVIGKATNYFEARAAVCERAGIDSTLMPWDARSHRTLQRLLDEKDSSVTVMDGWSLLLEPPPLVDSIACTSVCPICSLMTVNLFTAKLYPKRPRDGRSPSPPPPPNCRHASTSPMLPHSSDAGTSTDAGTSMDAGTSTDGRLSSALSSAFANGPPPVNRFGPICDVDRSRFMPMIEFNFATWRQGLPRPLARAAVVTPQVLEALERAWELARLAFESTGANALQFISFIESVFPYEFNLLAHAAVGIERHRLAESCIQMPPPSDASILTALGERMTARIIFAMTGTSSVREREDGDARNPTYLRNSFNGSIMREICILHSLKPQLLLSLQTHLGIAVRAAVNLSELAQYLNAFQIVPNEELSRQWLLRVQHGAQENRATRLLEWLAAGDGWTVRFDNCDVGKLLHFVALIATRDRAPPAPPFPYTITLMPDVDTLMPDACTDDEALASAVTASAITAALGQCSRSSCAPTLTSLRLLDYEQLTVFEVAAVQSWWALFDTAAASIDRQAASQAAGIGRADLLRRTKGGKFNTTVHSARSLGPKLELEACGPPPTPMETDPRQASPMEADPRPAPMETDPRPTPMETDALPTPMEVAATTRGRTGATADRLRTTLLSPARRTVRALCDYSPSIHLYRAVTVRKQEVLTMLACEPNDTICLVRCESGEIGELPAYVIGQGAMVQPADRELWEMALTEGARVAPTPNRMQLLRQLLVEPGSSSGGCSPLNLNREGAYTDSGAVWTQQKKEARKKRRAKKAALKERRETDSDDDDDDSDYVGSDDDSDDDDEDDDEDEQSNCASAIRAPSNSIISNLHVRGKYGDCLLYLAPLLQKATDAGVTQACMASARLLHDDVRMRNEALWTAQSKVQRTPSFSADQQFHANEWAARERMLVSLVAEREQINLYLAKPGLDANLRASLHQRQDALSFKISSVFDETFDLGVMHAVIYLQRSAFQVAPDLLSRLLFSALPELERVSCHIIEVREGYWLVVQLLFGRLLVAWRAFRATLTALGTLEYLRAGSRSFALLEYVMEELVAPSVMLADAARGRSIAGELTPEAAWPLVLTAYKRGLRLLLLSGRHHLYVDCFGREIRAKLLLSEEQFAWWANNLWVRIGANNYFNDETVERFLIKVLKRDMEGGHFTEREAARSAATVEALQMVREELRAMVGGVRTEKADQASAEARHLQQQPAVPAALLMVLEKRFRSSIEWELDANQQAELARRVASAQDASTVSVSICVSLVVPPRHIFVSVSTDGWCLHGRVAVTLNLSRFGGRVELGLGLDVLDARKNQLDEMARLAARTGESDVTELRARLAAPLLNPFTLEAMENTDVQRLQDVVTDRVQRHVVGNFLNANKGFYYQVPPLSTVKETPIVIGPIPRKVIKAEKKVLKAQQQAKWALRKAGVHLGPWDVASPRTHILFGTPIWVTEVNLAKAKAWPALIELFRLEPWGLGTGASLGLSLLDDGIRRNVLLSPDGSREIACEAFGIDAFGDVRSFRDSLPSDESGKRLGIDEIRFALASRVAPLFKSFVRGYYPFDAGDLNPYKWVTFYHRAQEAYAKLSSEQKARLERAGGKLHESNFDVGEVTQSLKTALLDKLFGGREAALLTIGEAMRSPKLNLRSIVPTGCELTLHGVGPTPLRPITARVSALPNAAPGQQGTRHAQVRRSVEPKLDVVTGQPSANAEGEDQLWRHALEEVSRGAHFLSFISDTDFKVAALLVLPRLLFPDAAAPAALAIGHVFVASIDRSAPQTEKYWSLKEFVTAVSTFPALTDAIRGGPPLLLSEFTARRIRCAHVAAILILMGGDTTPSIYGLTEEIGLQLGVGWTWYTGALVEPVTHRLSGLEVFQLVPEAVTRLHKVWYVLRTTPNIKKLLKYTDSRARDTRRVWFDNLKLDQVAAAVLQKVPPVGVPGQPARSMANLRIIMIVTNARMQQWGLAPCPDAALFEARDGLRAAEGRQCGPLTTELAWDLLEVGKQKAKKATEVKPPPPKLSAAELFRKFQNDLRGVDSLPGRPQNERRQLLVGQLVARGGAESDFHLKTWQQLKRLLLAALHAEAPPVGVPDEGAPPALPVAVTATSPTAQVSSATTSDDDEDEGDAPDAASSDDASDGVARSDDEDDGSSGARQRFFCCTNDERTGGFWWCAPCSRCFHHACPAHAEELKDGTNKMCKQCHAQIMAAPRSTRQRTR